MGSDNGPKAGSAQANMMIAACLLLQCIGLVCFSRGSWIVAAVTGDIFTAAAKATAEIAFSIAG